MTLSPGHPPQVFQHSHCFNHREDAVHAHSSAETLVWAKAEAQICRLRPVEFHRVSAELSALVGSRSQKLTAPEILPDPDQHGAGEFTAVSLYYVFQFRGDTQS